MSLFIFCQSLSIPGKTCIIELHLCIFSFISVPVPNFLPLILLLPWALLLNSSSSLELQHCTMLNTFLSFVPLVAESRELHATVQQYTRWRHKLAAFLWRPLQLFAFKERMTLQFCTQIRRLLFL